MLSLLVERALSGETPRRDELAFLEAFSDLDALAQAAHLVTRRCASPVFNFCTIANAKSSKCAEDYR